MRNPDQWYTPEEVAELLQIKIQTVYQYVREGKLAAHKFRKPLRISPQDFADFVSRHKSRRGAHPDIVQQPPESELP